MSLSGGSIASLLACSKRPQQKSARPRASVGPSLLPAENFAQPIPSFREIFAPSPQSEKELCRSVLPNRHYRCASTIERGKEIIVFGFKAIQPFRISVPLHRKLPLRPIQRVVCCVSAASYRSPSPLASICPRHIRESFRASTKRQNPRKVGQPAGPGFYLQSEAHPIEQVKSKVVFRVAHRFHCFQSCPRPRKPKAV